MFIFRNLEKKSKKKTFTNSQEFLLLDFQVGSLNKYKKKLGCTQK